MKEFASVVVYQNRILAFEIHGEVYEFNVGSQTWTLLTLSPWPTPDNPTT